MTRRIGPLPRHPGDVVRIGVAAALLAASAAVIHRDRVGVEETDVFRVLNDLPGWLFPVVWPVMQLGSLAAVPLVAVVAAGFRRYRLAAEIAFAGVTVWVLAKVVKRLVERGRPTALLPDVHVHGAPALGGGYLSGHAAVAFATATLVSPYLSRGWRRLMWSLALTVCAARVYVGAHLPLDVVAGAALGWGAASLAHLVLGAPTGRPSPRTLARTLTALHLTPQTLTPVTTDGRRSDAFHVRTDSGRELFVKVVATERRDRDLLYRAWLWLAGAGRVRRPHGPPPEQAEHEAAMMLAAERCGVRVPRHVTVGRYPGGGGLLVNEWVRAVPIERAPATASVVADAWHQLAMLHAGGQAHGHLTGDNVLVTDAGDVVLVDFDRSTLHASADRLAEDRADLRALLARLSPATATDVTPSSRDGTAAASP